MTNILHHIIISVTHILDLASGVTPKYTNMSVYFGVTPDAKPRRQVFCVLVEYRLKGLPFSNIK